MNTEHTTTPVESGVRHDWTVSDGNNRISMHVFHFEGTGIVDVIEVAPSVADLVLTTESGWWLFVEILSHRTDGEGHCKEHHFCDVEAFASSYANPTWERIRASGLADDSVFAELRRVHVEEFGRVVA